VVRLCPVLPVRAEIPLLTVTQRLRNDMIIVGAGCGPGTQRCTDRKIRMAARYSLLLEPEFHSLHKRLAK